MYDQYLSRFLLNVIEQSTLVEADNAAMYLSPHLLINSEIFKHNLKNHQSLAALTQGASPWKVSAAIR